MCTPLTSPTSPALRSATTPLVAIGTTCTYDHTDYDLHSNVAFNQAGGRDLKLRDLRTDLFGLGLQATYLIPMPAESAGYYWTFGLSASVLLGSASGNFQQVPFSVQDRQLYNSVDAEQYAVRFTGVDVARRVPASVLGTEVCEVSLESNRPGARLHEVSQPTGRRCSTESKARFGLAGESLVLLQGNYGIAISGRSFRWHRKSCESNRPHRVIVG